MFSFGLNYGTQIESMGLGIKYQYNITDPIRLEPSLNYFFENDNVSMLDFNVNLHYLCPVGRGVKLYPLFGLTLTNWMLDIDTGFGEDIDDNECRFGVNLGGGVEFDLGHNWAINLEGKYQLVSDFVPRCNQHRCLLPLLIKCNRKSNLIEVSSCCGS